MPHVITGQIRKAPYTKTGTGAKGDWKMYAVELSEYYKDKDGNKQYTNYRAVLFASSPAQISAYDKALQVGRAVSVMCDKLQVNQREYEGKTIITLEPLQPQLVYLDMSDAEPQQGGGQQQNNGWGQPQQQQQQQHQAQQQQKSAPIDYDSEIPFAPIGLQYAKHAIYCI